MRSRPFQGLLPRSARKLERVVSPIVCFSATQHRCCCSLPAWGSVAFEHHQKLSSVPGGALFRCAVAPGGNADASHTAMISYF